ncbi:hypothetical protein GY45DRAFT_1376294 [Cubamyces sp. BRFM 1775]|nr:hypothetical protein GY45DRAFT_1376294 [Cubamyces sp. BRFM 1775]
MSSANENVPPTDTASQAKTPRAESSAQPACPAHRVKEVNTRSLTDVKDTRELAQVMLDAITGYKRLYKDASVLYGDVNPNTLVIFEPAAGAEEGARAMGALIEYDGPRLSTPTAGNLPCVDAVAQRGNSRTKARVGRALADSALVW